MTQEVLIVGDPSGRRGFADEVAALGYPVALCDPRELNRRIRSGQPPTAIIACIADVEPDMLLASLRRTRAGASIPVLLYGRLGGSLRDLADVLDIGADHFLEDPVAQRDLSEALLQYAGTPTRPAGTRMPAGRDATPTTRREEPRRPGRPGATDPLSPTPDSSTRRLASEPRGGATETRGSRREPVLGDLHRTLDRLEARLRGRDDSDPELASLGLESIPDVDEDEVDEHEPLVTDIGLHLRGRDDDARASSRTPTRPRAASEPDERPRARSTSPRAPERESDAATLPSSRFGTSSPTSLRESSPREPARRPESTERLGDRSPPGTRSGEGTSRSLPRPSETRIGEGTSRSLPRPSEMPSTRSGEGTSRSLPRPGEMPSTRAGEGTSRSLPRPGETRIGDGTSRNLPRPDDRSPLREATGRWGKPPGLETKPASGSSSDPARSLDPGRSAVLMGRRPDRPGRPAPSGRASVDERSEPWPSPDSPFDDDFEQDDDTGRVAQQLERETPTRVLRGERDRGPLRPRDEEPERATSRIDSPTRPVRRQDSPWADERPERVERREPERREPERREPERVERREPERREPERREPERGRGGGRRLDLSLRDAGKLGGEVDVPLLLWQLYQQRFTGRVRLHRQRIEKQVWLVDGEPVFARSNATSDRLIDALLRRGVLTEPQYETARRLAAKEPRRAGQLLVDAGFIKPRELETLLRDHLARVIDSTLAWNEGSFSTEPGERCDEPILLDTPLPSLLLAGLQHRFDAGELEQQLRSGALAGTTTPIVPRLRESLGGDRDERASRAAEILRLSGDDELVLTRLDGRRAIPALLAEGIDEQRLLALLRVLELAGCVELGARTGDDDELGHAARGGDDSRAPAQVDSLRILERLRLAREADYFQLLGLGRDAARSEIRQAHAELRATFDEGALELASRELHARELRELRSALDEALDILVDDAMRSAYLAHLQEPD